MILIVTKEHTTELGEVQEVGKRIDVHRQHAKMLIKQGLAKEEGKPTLLQSIAEKAGLKKKKKSKGPWHKSNPEPEKKEIDLPADKADEDGGKLHK